MLRNTLAIICLLAATAPTQKTWVVDMNKGPGTDFTDLPAAVKAAAAGDRVVVRAGFYHMFEATKPMAILALPGVRIGSGTNNDRSDILIRGLRAGETFSMHGFDSLISYKPYYTRIENCAGTVLLEGTGISIWRSVLGPVQVTGSADVRVVNCRLARMDIRKSTVLLERCEMPPLIQFGGVYATDSRVHVAGSVLQGSSYHFALTSSAVVLTRSKLVATRSSFKSGTFGTGSKVPLHAIAGTGEVEYDPKSTFAPTFGGKAIDPQIRATKVARALLAAFGAPAGGAVHVNLSGAPGDRYGLYVGFPAPLARIPGVGEVGLTAITPVAFGALDGNGSAGLKIAVPTRPTLDVRGLVVTWQAFTHSATNPAAFSLTSPSSYVHGIR